MAAPPLPLRLAPPESTLLQQSSLRVGCVVLACVAGSRLPVRKGGHHEHVHVGWQESHDIVRPLQSIVSPVIATSMPGARPTFDVEEQESCIHSMRCDHRGFSPILDSRVPDRASAECTELGLLNMTWPCAAKPSLGLLWTASIFNSVNPTCAPALNAQD